MRPVSVEREPWAAEPEAAERLARAEGAAATSAATLVTAEPLVATGVAPAATLAVVAEEE
jgi:hypothetical protein